MNSTEQAFIGAIGALTAALLALVAIVRRKSRKPENGHDEAIRDFLHSDEGRTLIHKAARHEIANAVAVAALEISRLQAPDGIDAYRREAIAAVAKAFQGWKE